MSLSGDKGYDDLNLYIDDYLKNYKNYKTYWNYEDGCVLKGMLDLYRVNGSQKYLDFISCYLDRCITEDGTIITYEPQKNNVDNINCGKVLFYMYDYTKNEKYHTAISFLAQQIKKQPRITCGNFWHKDIYPGQVWLDGLYMLQPFYMEYELKFNNGLNTDDIISQFMNVRKYMFDENKKLYYHAYDDDRSQFWADSCTGLSRNFWLRSIGWFMMALADTIELLAVFNKPVQSLSEIFTEAADGIVQYQDKKTKLFYQIVDDPDYTGNYTETSGSLMISYSFMKGAALGVLAPDYAHNGAGIFDSVINDKLIFRDSKMYLTDICLSAGLGFDPERDGSKDYYLSTSRVDDDAKGTGVLMMAYAQRIMYREVSD
ncbi:MAG: glycoside hydrolase family 88 protein [Oscillospiraceae bacterium]|nr:glycoside hydrolase family 88 protein [Oscillospiraceae bacterium]